MNRRSYTARVGKLPWHSSLTMSMLFLAATIGCDTGPVSHARDQYPSQIEVLAGRSAPSDPLHQSQQRGRKVYEHYCQICHGANAQGDGFNAAMLDPQPRNFTDTKFWKQATDEQLLAVISKGGPAAGKSVLMPAWGKTLDETQIRDVIAYLRTAPEAATNVDSESLAE